MKRVVYRQPMLYTMGDDSEKRITVKRREEI